MGGFGSGRSSTRSLVERAQVIDLTVMMRRGQVRDGHRGRFKMRFVSSGEYVTVFHDLCDPYEGWIELNYRQFFDADIQPEVAQHISLAFTNPYFGGRRWWMICPYAGQRVTKLYLPPGGNTFACREEWGLVYESQRRDQFRRTVAGLGRLERQLERQDKAGHLGAGERN